jgi:hypothetical protein
MFKDLNGRKFMTFLRFGIAALTIVASTEAFARGEAGGGGGAGEGGAGEGPRNEVARGFAPPTTPQLETPHLTIDLHKAPVVIQNNNCKLEWQQLRYC